MRYPRLLIVLFVALGIVVLPTVDASAADTDALSDALRQVETLTDISQQAAIDADLARRGGTVELLAERVDVDPNQAGHLLDAMTALVVLVTGAGERAGVLESPEIDALFDVLVGFIRSSEPQSEQAFAKADFLTERAIVAAELLANSERTAMTALISTDTVHGADPV
ncbi:MAG: hypothetical protein U9N78_00055, partial [Actinomycetota bacterium]|nr:hypothetical protein [Actinomycetota bacterium]